MTTKPASSVFEKMTDYEKTYRIKGLREHLSNGLNSDNPFNQALVFHAFWADLPISYDNSAGFMSSIMEWKPDIYTPDGFILVRSSTGFGARRGAICVGEDSINIVSMIMESKLPRGVESSGILSIKNKANKVSPEEWKKRIEHIRLKDNLWKYYSEDLRFMPVSMNVKLL